MVSSTSRALYVDSICDKRKHLFHDVDPLFCGCLIDDERRVDADIGIVAHDDQATPETFFEDHLARFFVEFLLCLLVLHELNADEQAASTDVSHKGELRLESHELVEHECAYALRVLHEIILYDCLHRNICGSGGQRVAAVARRASAWIRKWLREDNILLRHYSRHRVTAAETLADRHDIRHDLIMLAAEHFSRAPEAGDHFIDDEDSFDLIGDPAELFQISRRRNKVAVRSLNRLDDNRSDIIRRL